MHCQCHRAIVYLCIYRMCICTLHTHTKYNCLSFSQEPMSPLWWHRAPLRMHSLHTSFPYHGRQDWALKRLTDMLKTTHPEKADTCSQADQSGSTVQDLSISISQKWVNERKRSCCPILTPSGLYQPLQVIRGTRWRHPERQTCI